MYICKNKECGKTIFQNKEEKGIVEFNGVLYCEACGEPLVEETSLDEDKNSFGLSGSQAVLNSTSDNRIIKDSNNTTTTNIYNGPQEEMMQTKYGMFSKKDLRLCVSCNNWVPVEYYENSTSLCRDCMECLIIKDGDGLYEERFYDEAIATYLKAEKNGVLTAEIRCKIGRCYMELKDWKNAIKYFALSKKDSVQSLYYLGYCYEHATEGIKDNGKAEDYYRQAAARGDSNAQRKVNLIEQEKAAREKEAQRKLEEERRAKEVVEKKDSKANMSLIIKKTQTTENQINNKQNSQQKGPLILDQKNNLWGFVDANGKVVIPHKYDKAHPFEDGMAIVCRYHYWGCVNLKGDEIISTESNYYRSLQRIKGEIFMAEQNAIPSPWYYLINAKTGKRIFAGKSPSVVGDGIIVAQNEKGRWGTLNEFGIEEISFIYSKLEYVNGLFIAVDSYGQYGVISTKGNTLFRFLYKRITIKRGEVIAIAEKKGIYGFLDLSNNVEKCFIYQNLDYLSTGVKLKGFYVLEALKEGKYGLINVKGDEILPFIYDEQLYLHYFGDVLGYVFFAKKCGKYGLINIIGKELLPFIYDDIRRCYNLIFLKKNGKWGAIDKKKDEIIPFIYENLEGLTKELIRGMKGGKIGLLDMKGNEITPFIYEEVEDTYDFRNVIVAKKSAYGLINTKGKELTEFVYDYISSLNEDSNRFKCYAKKYRFIWYNLEGNIHDKSFSESINIRKTLS